MGAVHRKLSIFWCQWR